MATEKQLVTELRKAREAAQLFKEAVEAEKQATYTLGVEETQARLTEEFSAVVRDYCDISQGKALDVAGVPADSGLRRLESIYYDPEIRELSDPNSSLPEQAAQVFEVPKMDQVSFAPLEVLIDSYQDTGRGKEAETLQGKDKGKEKKKNSSNPVEKALDIAISQPEQAADPGAPKVKAQARVFIFYSICILFFLCLLFFFFKEMYHLSLSMKISFLCFTCHDKYYKIDCLSMMIFCHLDLNKYTVILCKQDTQVKFNQQAQDFKHNVKVT